jgi:hypothetical protein
MDRFYAKTDYVPLADIGLDVNFNKHYNHGVELRIFDQIPLSQVGDICRVMAALGDIALTAVFVRDPRKSAVWQGLAERCLLEGRDMLLSVEDQATLASVFGCPGLAGGNRRAVVDFYKDLCAALAAGGDCAERICADAFLRGKRPSGEAVAVAAPPAVAIQPAAAPTVPTAPKPRGFFCRCGGSA